MKLHSCESIMLHSRHDILSIFTSVIMMLLSLYYLFKTKHTKSTKYVMSAMLSSSIFSIVYHYTMSSGTLILDNSSSVLFGIVSIIPIYDVLEMIHTNIRWKVNFAYMSSFPTMILFIANLVYKKVNYLFFEVTISLSITYVIYVNLYVLFRTFERLDKQTIFYVIIGTCNTAVAALFYLDSIIVYYYCEQQIKYIPYHAIFHILVILGSYHCCVFYSSVHHIYHNKKFEYIGNPLFGNIALLDGSDDGSQVNNEPFEVLPNEIVDIENADTSSQPANI